MGQGKSRRGACGETFVGWGSPPLRVCLGIEVQLAVIVKIVKRDSGNNLRMQKKHSCSIQQWSFPIFSTCTVQKVALLSLEVLDPSMIAGWG